MTTERNRSTKTRHKFSADDLNYRLGGSLPQAFYKVDRAQLRCGPRSSLSRDTCNHQALAKGGGVRPLAITSSLPSIGHQGQRPRKDLLHRALGITAAIPTPR
jgi:hypothetical protein